MNLAYDKNPVWLHQRGLPVVRVIAWAVAVVVGLIETFAMRFWLSADATNYLDVASAYLRRDFHEAINAYWSPLFSWILAGALAVFHPAPESESTLVHVVNLGGFLLSLRAFEYFLSALLEYRSQLSSGSPEENALPDIGFWVVGYSVFFVSSFFTLYFPTPTPDAWVCMFTYLAAGLLISIRVRGASWMRFIALGFVLALAYLAKTIYFPLSFVFLLAAWAAAGLAKKSFRFAAASLLSFALLAGSWIAVLSRSEQRFTFGDVGKIAFDMYVGRILFQQFWQGENSTGTPLHPVRRLLERPALFEFATPWNGTHPAGLHWAYWARGLRLHFDLAVFLSILRQSAGTYFVLVITQAEFLFALFFLFFLQPEGSTLFTSIRGMAFLWVPPLVACLAYALVLVEGRYVASFLTLLWIAAFFCMFQAAGSVPRKTFLALVLAVAAVSGLRIAKLAVSDFIVLASHPRNLDAEVAEALRGLGLSPGDRIASLGSFADLHWARQAGLSVVAEIPRGNENFFWRATPERKDEIFRVLSSTGAKFVVTPGVAPNAAQEGWLPLGQTAFFAHALPAAGILNRSANEK